MLKILGIPPHQKLKIAPNYILILIGTSSRTTWKNINIEHRTFFVKFCTGNNYLFLKKNRYESLAREERLCPLCNIEVKELQHFVFKCP